MRLLLDENLPKRLRFDLPDFEVYTVGQMGWNGKKNGELLTLMEANGFGALLTFDKNMTFQQNLRGCALFILILHAPRNTYKHLAPLTSEIAKVLKRERHPRIIHIYGDK